MTDHLGYVRFKYAGTKESPTNNAGTLNDDSDCDSEEDEPTIVVSSNPPHTTGSQDEGASHMDDCTYAEDLARLQRQEQEA